MNEDYYKSYREIQRKEKRQITAVMTGGMIVVLALAFIVIYSFLKWIML